MNSEPGPHRPLARAGHVPCQAYPWLPQRQSVVLDEGRFPDERLRLHDAIRIKKVIRRVPIFLVDPRAHLVPQSEPQREIPTEFHFILKIPSGLRGTEGQLRRLRLGDKPCRTILEKG